MFNEIKSAVISADIWVFRIVNSGLYNKYFAVLMKYAANDVFLVIAAAAGFFLLFRKWDGRDKADTAFSLWAVITVNFISSRFLKPLFARKRPVAELSDVNFLVEMRRLGYAFPSTHTAMAAALAAALWDRREARPYLALFVFLTAFFCVYTGGHYPLDTAAGLVLGVFTGRAAVYIKRLYLKRSGYEN
ncbi:MAG: phosphatase PAP2 family protein [Candidatus Goldbacteria bacterium]|nr:phosphatase PAP2 family protein [Candidatus Goldiibacteriota bacterium]